MPENAKSAPKTPAKPMRPARRSAAGQRPARPTNAVKMTSGATSVAVARTTSKAGAKAPRAAQTTSRGVSKPTQAQMMSKTAASKRPVEAEPESQSEKTTKKKSQKSGQPKLTTMSWKERFHSKKFWCIVASVVIILALTVMTIIALVNKGDNDADSDTDDTATVPSSVWEEKYLDYLSDALQNKNTIDDQVNLENMEDAEVSLYDQSSWASPVMVISYRSKANGKDYTYFVAINKGGKDLTTLGLSVQYDIKHYYNILSKTDDYYTVETGADPTFACFIPLAVRAQLDSAETDVEGAVCTITIDTEVSQSPDSKVQHYLFDEIFIPLSETKNSFKLDAELSEDDLKDKFQQSVAKLDGIKDNTKKEFSTLEAKIAAAEQRVTEQKQKKEEESKAKESSDDKSSSSEASNNKSSDGILVGGSLVKYGTYTMYIADDQGGDEDTGGKLYIRSDGTASKVYSDGQTESYASYKAETYGFTQDGVNVDNLPAIVFYTADGQQAFALQYRNGTLCGVGLDYYKYAGN